MHSLQDASRVRESFSTRSLFSSLGATIGERTSVLALPGCIFPGTALLVLHFRRRFLHVIFKHGVLGGLVLWILGSSLSYLSGSVQ